MSSDVCLFAVSAKAVRSAATFSVTRTERFTGKMVLRWGLIGLLFPFSVFVFLDIVD